MGGAPLLVNASFILSGMLGLQLHIPDGHGNFSTVETSVPFTSSTGELNNEQIDGQRTGRAMDNELKMNMDFVMDMDNNANSSPNTSKVKCGSKDCDLSEKCVSWQNKDDSSMLFQECLPDDGRFSTKSNPLSSKLCKSGETHSIILTEAQPCLEDEPPCNIIWQYRCVKEAASPHNCSLKRCPPNFLCLESIQCSRNGPCVVLAECYHRSRADSYH